MSRAGTAVLFPGQGSQVPGMGRRAAEASPRAAALYDAASAAIDRDLRELCWHAPLETLTRTENLQPALTVAALADWLADDDRPDPAARTAGHSVGALAAAAVAGALDPVDAVRLAAARGALMASAPAGGAMLAVATPKTADEAAQHAAAVELAERFDVDVAAVNGPTQVVLAGAADRIDAAAAEIGGRSKRLEVSNAFHSRFMAPVADEWARTLEGVAFADGAGGYVGCASGALAADGDAVRADLRDGLTGAVRWMAVLQALDGCADFDVYGPGRAIARLARPFLDGRAVRTHEPAGAR
ncbi:MAG: ACP S-malonyltransferase [Microbacteriaceae bacterium]|nr:ACP S-malonyltransferase [Microbacteriaceae bacterium]